MHIANCLKFTLLAGVLALGRAQTDSAEPDTDIGAVAAATPAVEGSVDVRVPVAAAVPDVPLADAPVAAAIPDTPLADAPVAAAAAAANPTVAAPAAAASAPVPTRTTNVPPLDTAPQVAGAFPTMPAGVAMAAAASSYPHMPTSWPDPDEAKGPIVLESLLNSDLVRAGLAKVQGIVSPTLLQIKPSIRNDQFSDMIYVDDPVQNCYWFQCHAPVTKTPYLIDDVTTCVDSNVLGLNFDDGPSGAAQAATQGNNTTAGLGEKLKSMNLKATFFVTGGASYYNPDALQTLAAEGHEIAVHTWTHTAMTSLTNAQIVAEVLYTEAFIYALIGQRPRYFRPPYGDTDDRVRSIVGALGYESVMWQESKDLADQGVVTPTLPNMVAKFESWMTPQPGYIDLEHSLLAPVNMYAAAILDMVAARKKAGLFVPNIMPVGECQKRSSYVPLDFVLGAATPAGSGTPVVNSTTAGASKASGSASTARNPSVADSAAWSLGSASSVVAAFGAAAAVAFATVAF